ncbi:MAG: DUF2339 domain-containing protein [Thermoanaerobaculia bacterium]
MNFLSFVLGVVAVILWAKERKRSLALEERMRGLDQSLDRVDAQMREMGRRVRGMSDAGRIDPAQPPPVPDAFAGDMSSVADAMSRNGRLVNSPPLPFPDALRDALPTLPTDPEAGSLESAAPLDLPPIAFTPLPRAAATSTHTFESAHASQSTQPSESPLARDVPPPLNTVAHAESVSPGHESVPSSEEVPASSAPPPLPPAARPPSGSAPAKGIDWEAWVGVKLFSWIAGIALVVGAVSFLKYSLDQGLLSPPVRMAIGLVTGLALLVVCELKAARLYRVTANAMDGAAIAILFSTFFASHALWKLLPAIPTFLLMALVTAVAVLLSIRRDSLFIALLGLVGGFATPALLSSGQDRPIGLFGYLLMLNAGLAWVAHRKRWPILSALTLVFTALYQWGWVWKFMAPEKLPLSLGIFLVFPILSFASLSFGEKQEGDADHGRFFRRTAALGAAVPLVFALFLATVPAYGARWELLFGFLLVLDLGLLAVAVWRGPEALHLGAGAATLLVFAIWLSTSYRPGAWPGILGFVALFVLLYLAAPFVVERARAPFCGLGARAVFAAPLLLFVFPVLIGLEPRTASPGLVFGVLFALLAAGALHAIGREEGGVHFIGAIFALAAEAVWSARHLAPARLLPALGLYALFALFFLGVPLLARERGKRLKPEGSAAVLLFVSLGLLLFLAAGPVASVALWGLALLLAVLNAGLFFEGSSGRFPLMTIAGVVLSWVVLGVWWASANLTALLVPALVVTAGFTLLTLGGNVWASKRSDAGDSTPVFRNGLYLGLVGHAFLLVVVTRPELSIPPWPVLGVLLVIDLAIGVAALVSRQGELHAAALIASQLVLIGFESVSPSAPWPSVAGLSALGVAVLGVAFMEAWTRRGGLATSAGPEPFAAGAALSLLLGQGVAIVAAARVGTPALGLLVTLHLAFIAGLLWVAFRREWHGLAIAAVLPAFLGAAVFHAHRPEDWKEALTLAAALYAPFLVYPVLLGARVKRSREPFLAAVLASALFFLLARTCLLQGGFSGVIGLLPVAQAFLMAGLLAYLLKLEPPQARSLDRLALVAGAALAFITIAIPLQLDKEWITIGWAIEGAALAWLFTRLPHRGLLTTSVGLLLAVFVRLTLNRAVLGYHPRGSMPILNWYSYTYLVSAASLFIAAYFLSRTNESLRPDLPRPSKFLPPLATLLLFLLVNIEVADYFSTGPALTFQFDGAGLAQDLAYTIAWLLFALGLLTAGVMRQSRPVRMASIALLVITILKAFVHDLGRLGGLYRVGSFVGLAICLALVALAIQKFVLARATAPAIPADEPRA